MLLTKNQIKIKKRGIDCHKILKIIYLIDLIYTEKIFIKLHCESNNTTTFYQHLLKNIRQVI